MKRLLFLSIFFLLYSCATNYSETEFRDKYIFSVKLDNTNFTENISFESKMGLPIIPIKIEGKTYNFLFDTGALTTVSPKFKNILSSIPEKSNKSISDASGLKGVGDFFILPNLTIGNIDFSHIGVYVQDLSTFNNHCVNIDGIIGANLLKTAFWKINFETKMISFSDNKNSIDISQPGLILSFKETFGGNPISKLKWNENEFWAMWDTGYNSSLQISDSLFFKNKTKKSSYTSGKGIGIASLYSDSNSIKFTEQYTALLDSLYFVNEKIRTNTRHNKFLLEKTQIQIAPYPAPTLLGTKLIKTGKEVLFDWKDQKIIFKEIPSLEKPEETFGFTPFKIKDAIIITSIWNNSTAEEKGLNIGDTISAINGINLERSSLNKWCENFVSFKEKDSISLIIKKGKERKAYTLKKYPIFNK